MFFRLLIVGLALTVTGTHQGSISQDLGAEWQRVLQAKGGAALLHQVRILAWSSSDPRRTSRAFGGVEYQFVELYPDRFWAWEDYRPGTLGFAVEVWNRPQRLNWYAQEGGRAVRKTQNTRSEAFRLARARQHQVLFLLESATFRPRVIALRRTESSLSFELEVEGFANTTVTVDRQTMLPSILSFGLASAPGDVSEYRITGYQDVSGMKLPSEINHLGKLTFDVNPNIDLAIFDAPPSGVTSRDHWRTFIRKYD